MRSTDTRPETPSAADILASQAPIRFGDIVIDSERGELVGKETRRIFGKKLKLLRFLAVHHGKVMVRNLIMDYLYEGLNEPEFKIVDVFVCHLRKDLISVSDTVRIETIWGRGYKLVLETNDGP